MEHLDGILKLVENEIKAINENGKFRSREEIDSVYKLVDIVKDIYCIDDMEEDGESYRGSYRDSYRYDDGMSYARGRRGNVKRYADGRFAPYSREGRGYTGYSRGGKEEYIEQLRAMMDDAPDDNTRQSIQRMINQME